MFTQEYRQRHKNILTSYDGFGYRVNKYANFEFHVYDLIRNGFKLQPTKEVKIVPDSLIEEPILDTVNKKWDKSNFSIPRKPIVLSKLKGAEKLFGEKTPRVLELPIKLIGQTDFRIPIQFKNCKGLIQKVINYESSINKNINDYYAYLTVDNSFVQKNDAQRTIGIHCNGFQSSREKREIERHYLVYSDDTDLFYVYPFKVDDLGEETHDFFESFEKQVEKADIIEVWRPDPYELILADAYTVRAAVEASYAGTRKFFRLTFSKYKFDRLGNSINPMIETGFIMKPIVSPFYLHV